MLFNAINHGLNIFADGATILIFLVYLLLGRERPTAAASTACFDDQLDHGDAEDPRRLKLQHRMTCEIQEYLTCKTLIALLNGLLAGVILALFGVPFYIVFATLTFFLDFIPNIGSILGTLMTLPILLLDPNLGVWQMKKTQTRTHAHTKNKQV